MGRTTKLTCWRGASEPDAPETVPRPPVSCSRLLGGGPSRPAMLGHRDESEDGARHEADNGCDEICDWLPVEKPHGEAKQEPYPEEDTNCNDDDAEHEPAAAAPES